MAQGFVGNITLSAGVATQLSAALVTAGYAGSMIGAYLEIDDLALTDLRRGHSSAVSGSVGTPISAVNGGIYRREAQDPRLAIDPSRIWLFSATGGAITVSFDPF